MQGRPRFMVRQIMLSFFILAFTTVVFSAHAYVWWRNVYALELGTPAYVLFTALIIAGALAGPVGLPLIRSLPRSLARPAAFTIYLWMGSFFFLLCATLAMDFGLLVRATVVSWFAAGGATDPQRRLFLLRGVRFAGLAVASLAVWRSLFEVRQGPQIERVDVLLARLPLGLDGVTIAQISDLHVAPLLRKDYINQVVDATLALKADLIALTGDLVDGSVADLADDIAPLARLKARFGTYFVTGNHEYYSGADAWLAHLSGLGIRPLRNERVCVGEGDDSFDLAGIDDWTAHGFGGDHGADLPRALAGRDAKRELVLLAHQPRAAAQAREHGVGLMLSGHTHGGQLWPFGYLVLLVQPFLRGLNRLGDTWVYVNRGTGFWGPPMRLGSRPEITLLTLRSALLPK